MLFLNVSRLSLQFLSENFRKKSERIGTMKSFTEKPKIHIMSDMHMTSMRDCLFFVKDHASALNKLRGETVVICGDITTFYDPACIERFYRLFIFQFGVKALIHVPGNHEYFMDYMPNHFRKTFRNECVTLQEINRRIRAIACAVNKEYENTDCKDYRKVHFVPSGVYVDPDGQFTVVASTLWANPAPDAEVTDFRHIFIEGSDSEESDGKQKVLFSPKEMLKLHKESLKVLEADLMSANEYKLPVFVATHHSPIIQQRILENFRTQKEKRERSEGEGNFKRYKYENNADSSRGRDREGDDELRRKEKESRYASSEGSGDAESKDENPSKITAYCNSLFQKDPKEFISFTGFENFLYNIFASNPELLGHVFAWGFGHTHVSEDSQQNGIRFVSNPRGYYKEVNGMCRFDPSMSIAVPVGSEL